MPRAGLADGYPISGFEYVTFDQNISSRGARRPPPRQYTLTLTLCALRACRRHGAVVRRMSRPAQPRALGERACRGRAAEGHERVCEPASGQAGRAAGARSSARWSSKRAGWRHRGLTLRAARAQAAPTARCCASWSSSCCRPRCRATWPPQGLRACLTRRCGPRARRPPPACWAAGAPLRARCRRACRC